MVCPECHSLNQKFLKVTDREQARTIEFKCRYCGCIFAAKTEVKVLARSRK